MSDKTEQLRSILSLLGASATKQEIVDAFKTITKYVTDIKQGNEKEWSLIKSAISMLGDNLKDQNKSELDQTKKDLMDSVEKAIATLDSRVASLQNGEDGEDGEDGKDADESKIVAEVLAKIPQVVDETPEQTRDKLESLKGEERLDAKAIKGLDEIEKRLTDKVNSIPRGGHSGMAAHPMKFYDLSSQTNGTLKVFSVPKSVNAVVFTSDFPYVLIEGNGFTMNASRTTLTLTVQNAPSTGAQLLLQYSALFNTTT